ncbi:DoxX family protein [Pontibacter burrus]|uniref:DoxX family protein n=1 Tax=Pontibacter burrus TaxID=2704466 RepID=A0A6B3LTP4_9BACT|nr:DoxX family protein [Pontibacter burrus]NEM97626.1 DoxX family protein [Pontibacter burrus]
MDRFLGNYAPHFYALLRIVAGLLFAMHGTQKLFGWPGDGDTVELASLMGLAGIIELVGGLMIAFGVFASWAAFIASGEMAVAYFMAHAPQAMWPLQNQGELAALYCFLFLYIAARGAGIWSIDGARHRDRVVTADTRY